MRISFEDPRVVVVAFLSTLAAVSIAICYLIWQEEQEWAEFLKKNNCKVIGRMAGGTATGVGISPTGQVLVTTGAVPSSTGYACDDGKQYWR